MINKLPKMLLKIPLVPNFIVLKTGGSVPISAFDEKVLRGIGREWTKQLVAKAKKDSDSETISDKRSK